MSSSSSNMLALLPMMEAMYLKKRASKGASYKMVTSATKGVHVLATKEITTGELILVEEALHTQPSNNHPSSFDTPEYQSLIDVLAFYDQQQQEQQQEEAKASRSGGGGGGRRRFISRDGTTVNARASGCSTPPSSSLNPGRLVSNPACRIAYDRLSELNARAYITDSNGSVTRGQLEEIWKLEDSHRQACVGDTVRIDGLASAAGKKLNGKCGLVTQNDSTDPDRLGVQIGSTTNHDATKSIKRSNLKTLGGIMRTNSYQGHSTRQQEEEQQDTSNLFKELSRINHACGNAANVDKMILGTKVYVTAKRNIHIGEGIWIDYLPGAEHAEDRLDILHGMFNFWCDCSECQKYSGRTTAASTTMASSS